MADKRVWQVARRVTTVAVLGTAILAAGAIRLDAQNRPPAAQRPEQPAKREAAPLLDVRYQANDMERTRQDFLELLKLHPRLVDVVYHDPSLLANADYVRKTAPEVSAFLAGHPEVTENPEYFLGEWAARMHDQDTRRNGPDADRSVAYRIMGDLLPFLVFVCILGALLWVFRVLLENRRWSRIARTQAEVHTKLLEKFASNQELLAYMGTEAGKRFLESAPIPVDLDLGGRVSAPLGRILWSAQVGVILTMAGVGLLAVKSHIPDAEKALLVLGALILMLGVGFVLSAGLSYLMSSRLGLLDRAGAGPAA